MAQSDQQRCLQHNIVLSIYCTLCRKVLCASCMYNSLTHRKHRVVPVESAREEIKEDIKAFEAKLPRYNSQIEGLLSTNNELLMQLDKKSSAIQQSLKDFYEGISRVFKKKEEEQLRSIREFQEAAKFDIMCYNRELNKLNSYLSETFHSYTSNLSKPNCLMSARSVL
jgi:DNA repair exonuclease SbcCD ATPase subunit